MEAWSDAPDAFAAIEPILLFMECHPEVDFGTPGPLVHWVERFFGRAYEQKLIESVTRKPTVHTVWMVNRVINGTEDHQEKQRLVEILRKSANNPLADDDTRNLANRFIDRLVP